MEWGGWMLIRALATVLLGVLMLEQPATTQDAVTSQTNENQAKSILAERTSRPSALRSATLDTLIGGGDLLKISVFGVKDFDVDARVSARGSVSLPLLGEVQLAGLTPGEAERVVARRLVTGNFILEPQVSVFVKEYATQGISVLGEVEKPGIYPLLGLHGLFDVLSMAGGATQKSGPTVTITHRDRPNDAVTVNLVDVGKSADANAEVLPGDTVFVSKAGIVYIVGDVKNPSGIVIENSSDMTVLKAIAVAGGTNSTAAVNHAKLIRKTPSGHEESSIPLKKIFEGKAADLKLQPEDILFVPSSATRSAGRRGLEAVLQAATGVAIYRTP
jgi:polysaccharide biosynthesis/export protein